MKKVLIQLIVVMVMTISLCGCSGEEVIDNLRTGGQAQNAATAVICSSRSNSAEPGTTFFENTLNDIAAHSLYNAVITVEGSPRVVSRTELEKRKDFISRTTAEELIAEQKKKLASDFQDIGAKTEEADLFEAITLAAQEVKSHEGSDGVEVFRIYISDSMISTKGIVKMTSAALDGLTSPEEVSRNLHEQGLLPGVLSGCEIIVYGLGETAEPQMKLYENNKRALEAIWNAIFTKAGAKCIFKISTTSQTSKGSYPSVSPVIVTTPNDVFDPNGVNDFSEICHFKPGLAELLTDEAEVMEALRQYISYMQSHPDYRLLIAGTTASYDAPEVLRRLSYARCETIRQLLVTNGADLERIEVAGLGYETTTFCIKDTDDEGNAIEEFGQKNRRCLLMNADTLTASNVRRMAL